VYGRTKEVLEGVASGSLSVDEALERLSALDQYWPTSELAKRLSTSPAAIRNLVYRQSIPFRKPGGRLVFIKTEIDAWIDESRGLTLEQWRKQQGR
jgi:excisionase family DNA binding protein